MVRYSKIFIRLLFSILWGHPVPICNGCPHNVPIAGLLYYFVHIKFLQYSILAVIVLLVFLILTLASLFDCFTTESTEDLLITSENYTVCIIR